MNYLKLATLQMRFKGTLTEWRDDRGFGFIEPAEGGGRVFCHIKAFDVRVRRPIAGDRVTYELGKDAQGRSTAIKVRPVGLEEAQYQSNIRSHRNTNARQSLSATSIGVSICLIAIIGYAGFSYLKNKPGLTTTVDEQVVPTTLKSESRTGEEEQLPAFKSESETTIKKQSTAFQCDGRVYCSQMNSRAEAVFFINRCPNTKMDGNHDGVPCENDSRF
jgi:cold shock CspA family protein